MTVAGDADLVVAAPAGPARRGLKPRLKVLTCGVQRAARHMFRCGTSPGWQLSRLD